jgi:hypothetical protein
MAISCQAFSDFISRRIEHLDDRIIMSMHPLDSQWIGHVSTGRFAAEDGTEHTFDRFENVFPQLGSWTDVQATSCVGAPCDPTSTKVGLGFTRDSYKLQQKAYETDLFCWDLLLSADRATQQFAHFIRVLRRISTIVWSDRFRKEALRIAKFRWVCANNTLIAVNATWNAAQTQLTLTPVTGTFPTGGITSQLTARHLQRRVDPQIRSGAEGPTINKDMQPMLELVSDMQSVWNLVEGDPALTDHWRFNLFADGQKYYKYGWTGSVGNFGLRADAYQLRFDIVSTSSTSIVLGVVYPYTNVSATEGIKEDVNPDFDTARVKLNYIWHRKAMTSLVRDSKAINPEMPFAARDFAGKWQFVMDNLTCGSFQTTDTATGNVITVPIPVDNARRNKGKFITDFGGAIQAEYPELAEVFISLDGPACIVDVNPCADDPGYPAQNYSSSNTPCATSSTVITLTPVLDAVTSTYEVPMNTVTCNGIQVVHDAITGTTTLANLVIQMNTVLGFLGTWAVSASNITLTGTACTVVGVPWSI